VATTLPPSFRKTLTAFCPRLGASPAGEEVIVRLPRS